MTTDFYFEIHFLWLLSLSLHNSLFYIFAFSLCTSSPFMSSVFLSFSVHNPTLSSLYDYSLSFFQIHLLVLIVHFFRPHKSPLRLLLCAYSLLFPFCFISFLSFLIPSFYMLTLSIYPPFFLLQVHSERKKKKLFLSPENLIENFIPSLLKDFLLFKKDFFAILSPLSSRFNRRFYSFVVESRYFLISDVELDGF